MSDACRCCGGGAPEPLLSLPGQPVTNRFPASAGEPELVHPLRLGACATCGLVQLLDPVAPDELRPRVDWIGYAEPEAHLDGVARTVVSLPGIGPDAAVLGLSRYDEPLVERLHGLGIRRAQTLDWRAALGVTEPHAATETLQARLTVEAARALAAERGPADVIVARYVLEHAHAPLHFLRALRALVRPGGAVVLEVPDCTRPFADGDVGVLWEEHVSYYTPASFERCLAEAGLGIRASAPVGDLDAIVAVADESDGSGGAADVPSELARARAFAASLPDTRRRWFEYLRAEAESGRSVAMLGAGHTGAMVVNALGLGGRLACVVDDHPRKVGLRMPGSRLPIRPSSALEADGIGTCLLAVSPEAEERVVERLAGWRDAGGRFASLAPASARHPFGTAVAAT